MKRKFRWIDLALLPFGLCVLFLLLLGKLFGLTYKQISVVFNLWVQGAVLALSGLAPFGIAVYKMMESFSMDAGGDYPGVIMKQSESGIEMEVRLRAPLLSDKGYSIVVANHNNHTAIVMQDSPSDDNKRLLSKYLE